MTSVVVLSRFPEIFAGFKESVDRDAPEAAKIVVWDCYPRMQGLQLQPPWIEAQVLVPFRIAFNANHGWMQTSTNDLLYAGDDTRIIEPDTIKRLREVAYSDPKIGIVAARTTGRGFKDLREEFNEQDFVAFVFVFIKRAVIDAIGYMDERFEGYGVDDVEYCVRARMAGFKVGTAGHVVIQHGVDGKPHMSTFLRVKTHEQIAKEDAANWERFAEKYSLPNDRKRIWEFVRNLK